ncbi:MAG TPA: alpha/beta hydrolase [Gaiellaceae bacterium]|nr:alpha/beta hydrolase [Gaiellaceae bacterium]
MQLSVADVRLFVDVDGAQLRPDGAEAVEVPTIAIVHDGPGADHTTFKHPAFRPPLVEVAQLLFYDQRGHGRSDRSTPDRWRLDVWADDLAALLDTLGVDAPIVFGSGFGSLVATRFAGRHPERLAKLILSRPVARFDAARSVEAFARTQGADSAAAALDFYASPSEVTFAPWVMAVLRSFPGPTPVEIAELLLSADWFSRPAIHWYGGEARAFDLRDDAARIRVPTLVLAGEDDALMPIAGAEELVSAFDPSHVRFERFSAGNSLYAQDPRAMDVTLEFLRG